MEIIGTAFIFIGMIAMLIGGIWLLVLAFQESILWGLGCLVVPFVGLIFVITHWDEAKKPFLIQLAGVIPYAIGIFMSGAGAQ